MLLPRRARVKRSQPEHASAHLDFPGMTRAYFKEHDRNSKSFCQLLASTYPFRSSMPRCCGSRGVRAADQAPIGHRVYRDGLVDQAMEEPAPVARGAAVETKGKLVKVVGQVRSLRPALVRTEQPSLQEGGHAVDAWQQFVGGLTAAADHVTLVDVAGGGQPEVARPAVW